MEKEGKKGRDEQRKIKMKENGGWKRWEGGNGERDRRKRRRRRRRMEGEEEEGK